MANNTAMFNPVVAVSAVFVFDGISLICRGIICI